MSLLQVNTMTSAGSALLRLFCLESLRLWLSWSPSRPVAEAVLEEEEEAERAEDNGRAEFSLSSLSWRSSLQ